MLHRHVPATCATVSTHGRHPVPCHTIHWYIVPHLRQKGRDACCVGTCQDVGEDGARPAKCPAANALRAMVVGG